MRAIVEDTRGRVWIATDRGLDAYDPDRTLWVATLGGGLHHLDPATGRETRHLPTRLWA